MFGKVLKVIGSALGAAGVYGFLLYHWPWWSAALCLLVALPVVWAGHLLLGKAASAQDPTRSPQC